MFEDEDFEDDYDEEESEDWQVGQCDNCLGGPPIDSPLGPLCCACEIGQGAGPGDCRCGPGAD